GGPPRVLRGPRPQAAAAPGRAPVPLGHGARPRRHGGGRGGDDRSPTVVPGGQRPGHRLLRAPRLAAHGPQAAGRVPAVPRRGRDDPAPGLTGPRLGRGYSSTSPARYPSTTACVLSRAPSFASTDATCVRTVSTPTTSAAAISALVSPSATRPSTSRSRGVSGGAPCAARGRVRTRSRSACGYSRLCPTATVRTACTISSARARLSRNPDAPAVSASST